MTRAACSCGVAWVGVPGHGVRTCDVPTEGANFWRARAEAAEAKLAALEVEAAKADSWRQAANSYRRERDEALAALKPARDLIDFAHCGIAVHVPECEAAARLIEKAPPSACPYLVEDGSGCLHPCCAPLLADSTRCAAHQGNEMARAALKEQP